MPIKCLLKQQRLFLTPVKKCMNWHICKLISVFLQWPKLPCVLGCCILCLGKAENTSDSHNLYVAVLWGSRKERGFLKHVLKQEGAVDFRFSVAWREREDRPSLSPLIVICLYWSTPDRNSARTTIQLPFANPLTILRPKEILLVLPPPHVASLPRWAISERRTLSHMVVGKMMSFLSELTVTGCIWRFRVRQIQDKARRSRKQS